VGAVNRRPSPRLLETRFGAGQPVLAIGLRRAPVADLYHSLITWSWFRLFGTMGVAYVAVIALFALIYMALGDGAIEHARLESFEDAFFFSFQTMATIGYGHMLPKSTAANLVSVAQVMIGLAGTALSTGLVFAKFARPTARVLFSRVAVVTPFDGQPALLFRVANERANQIVEAQLNVALLLDEVTAEGEHVRRAYDLTLRRERSLLFSLTWLAVHPIGPGSPLHGLTADMLTAGSAALIVSLTGLDEHLGQMVHARHVYAAEELRFGQRFVDVIQVLPDGSRLIDYGRFHDVMPDGITPGAPPAGAEPRVILDRRGGRIV
jgi:inward rectifier potassium channel